MGRICQAGNLDLILSILILHPTSAYINMMTQLFIELGIDKLGDADLVITARDLGYKRGGNYLRSNGKFEIVLVEWKIVHQYKLRQFWS